MAAHTLQGLGQLQSKLPIELPLERDAPGFDNVNCPEANRTKDEGPPNGRGGLAVALCELSHRLAAENTEVRLPLGLWERSELAGAQVRDCLQQSYCNRSAQHGLLSIIAGAC